MDPTQTPRFGVDEAMDAMECAVGKLLRGTGKGYEDTAKRALGGALFVEEELVHADGEIVMWE
eukprot:jgi/Pico_ML_1/55067/g818.t2